MSATLQRPAVTDCTLEVIETAEALRAILPEWREFLADNVRGKNLFNDPRQIELTLAAESGFAHWIIILRRAGRIQCIAPFYFCEAKFPLQLSVFQLVSPKVRLAKLFGDEILISGEANAKDCYLRVFDWLRQERTRFDLVLLDRLILSSDWGQFCQSLGVKSNGLRFCLASPQIEKLLQIQFPPTHEQFLASLHQSTRQTLRRAARKLCDGRNARLERITMPEQVPAFLDQLDRVYRETWQAKTFGYQPRNTPAQLSYLRGMAEQGWLRSYLLVGDEGPIAFDLGYQYDGVFHAIETGYRQSWANFSPGAAMTYLYIEDMYRFDPPQILDFGVGSGPQKRRLSNVEFPAAAVYLAPPNRWRRLIALQRGIFGVDRGVRRALVALRLDRAVRKLVKRKR